jgi:hypothetical protein
VQTVKRILKKAKHDKTDPNLALLGLRNTPIEGIGKSPVQILMGRRTRTRLLTSSKLLEPLFNTTVIKPALERKQETQKKYYDRGTKPLQPLFRGEKVGIRDDGIWVPATVKQATEQPRSYTVERNGKEYRRNRRDLLKLSTVKLDDEANDTTTEPTKETEPPQTTEPTKTTEPPTVPPDRPNLTITRSAK